MVTKLFVGGFPLEMQELELVQMIAPYGDVATIKIVRDKKTKICKGYAFIEMTDRQNAEQVMDALDGADLRGRPLVINIVEEQPVAPKPNYIKNKTSWEPAKAKRPRRL